MTMTTVWAVIGTRRTAELTFKTREVPTEDLMPSEVMRDLCSIEVSAYADDFHATPEQLTGAEWVPAPGCTETHDYGADGWRPGGGDAHEHLTVPLGGDAVIVVTGLSKDAVEKAWWRVYWSLVDVGRKWWGV